MYLCIYEGTTTFIHLVDVEKVRLIFSDLHIIKGRPTIHHVLTWSHLRFPRVKYVRQIKRGHCIAWAAWLVYSCKRRFWLFSAHDIANLSIIYRYFQKKNPSNLTYKTQDLYKIWRIFHTWYKNKKLKTYFYIIHDGFCLWK